MKFLERLIITNDKKAKVGWVKDGKFNYHYVNEEEIFSGNTICDIIFHMNYLRDKYPKINLPVWFEIVNDNLKVADKLTYILMECLCYYYLYYENRNVRLFWEPDQSNILTDGINKSPLIYLNKIFSKKKFKTKFLSDESNTHYRKVYRLSDKESDPYYQSMIQTELDSFLAKMDINQESAEKISEICAELIGNTFEHAKSDCLIDIDLTDSYSKSEKGVKVKGDFKGVNIAIVNFSDKLLFEDIKYKLHSEVLVEEKYKKIMEAYKKHVNFFDDSYPEDLFYYFAATQLGISGRKEIQDVGGTGLYVLLQSLMEDSDLCNCYVLSGKYIVIFDEDYLYENEEHWMCYNKEKDFINFPPSERVIGECPIFFPGTAFNLNFVIEVE